MEKEFSINQDKCKLYSFITTLQILLVELIIFILLVYIDYLDLPSLLILGIFPLILDIAICWLYYQKLSGRKISVANNEIRYYIDEYNQLSTQVDNKFINYAIRQRSIEKVSKGILKLNLKGTFIKTENGMAKEVHRLQILNIINEYEEFLELLKKEYVK